MINKGFGVLNQVAYVVPDIDEAIAWWTGVMGVGPFFVFPTIPALGGDYRGQEMVCQFGAAIAWSGELMVELIEPRGPSIFADFAASGRTGVQHLCAFADDMGVARAAIEARGGRRLQGTRFEGGSEVAYFAMTGDESMILEIAVLNVDVKALFMAIKEAGADWDGTSMTISF